MLFFVWEKGRNMKKKLMAVWLSLMLTATLMNGTGQTLPTANAATYVDQSAELNTQFIGELLSRLGREYGSDNSGNGHMWGTYPDSKSYNCSGLISASLRAMKTPCPSTAGWSKWGKTADWKYWFNQYQDGDIVKFTYGTYTYSFQVRKTGSKTQNLNLYKTYASTPGTIMLKMGSGDTSGHMTVSLGSFPNMGSYKATEDYVRNALILKYSDAVANSDGIKNSSRKGSTLKALLAAGGKNNAYGHEAVWDYRNDNVKTRTDIGYNSVWQIDSLNDETGVTINNNPYGKTLDVTVLGVLVPIDQPLHGQAAVTIKKTDSKTAAALSGATFTLYEWSEKANKYVVSTQAVITESSTKGTYRTCLNLTGYTNVLGYVEFTADNQGKIKVVETKAPPGHSNINPKTGKAYEWSYSFVQDTSNPSKIFNETITATNKQTAIKIRKVAK